MEAKKNPAKDIHQMRGMFFQLGLGISIAIVIVVFEWTSEVRKPQLRVVDESPNAIPIIPVTNFEEPLPPSLIKNEIKPILSQVSFATITEVSSNNTNDDPDPGIETDELPGNYKVVFIKDTTEDVNRVWSFVEDPAKPMGGYEAFYEILKKNLKYPSVARRYGVEGKVFVEFIINKDGTPVDFKTIRGIGYGCDEEAIRVLKLTKWNPGKQRGNPVRVKMVLPVIFKLQ